MTSSFPIVLFRSALFDFDTLETALSSGPVRSESELIDTYRREVKQILASWKIMDFQHGVRDASESGFLRINQYLFPYPVKATKKSRQTLHSFLSFALRASTKTTPFSHLSTLSWSKMRDGSGSVDQVHIELHPLLLDAIWAQNSLADWMPYSLNSSLHLVRDHWIYGIEKDGKFLIKETPASPVLDYLVNHFHLKKDIPLLTIKKHLLEISEAEPEEAELFAKQLVEEAIFVKSSTIKQALSHKTDIPVLKRISKLFDETKDALHQYKLPGSLKKRWEDLSKLHPLSPDVISYRDVFTPAPSLPNPDRVIDTLLPDLQSYAHQMVEIPRSESILKPFFLKSFGVEARIPLLLFLDRYTDLEKPFQDTALDSGWDKRWNTQQVADKILLTGKRKAQGTLYCGAILRPWKTTASYAAYLEGFSIGHGRLLGRHIANMGENAHQDMIAWNAPDSQDGLFASVWDGLLHPTRIRPALCPYYITLPGGLRPPNGKGIPLTDLEVCLKDDRLCLWSISLQTIIKPLCLDITAPEHHTSIYRFLGFFSTSFRLRLRLRADLNRGYRIACADGWKHPSIWVGALMIQAVTYTLPVRSFPVLAPGNISFSTYSGVRQLQRRNNLPMTGFWRLQQGRTSPSKPQFLSFSSVLLVENMLRSFRRASEDAIWCFEACAPGLEQLKEMNPDGKAREWVVEMKV